RGVLDTDEYAAALHEALEIRQALPAETRTEIVGLGPGADIRRLRRVLPGKRISPLRKTLNDRRGIPTSRWEKNDVEFGIERRVLGDVLRRDVVVRDLEEVQRLPPPAFGLRVLPGVEQRDACRARRMRFHVRRGASSVRF